MTLALPGAGERVGARYELLDKLGEGGMAVVHRAHDRVEDRLVALKLLIPRYLGRPERERRIRDEAEYLRRLQGNPGIVEIVAAGRLVEHHDWPFVATELLAGRALQWALIDRKFSREDIHALALQIALALAACHAQGIVHRDLTPDNVFVDESTMRVKLFDFSHAGSLATPRVPAGTPGRLTGVHDVPGTAGYMAPEQALAEPASTAMDVFAFGVLVHELITGRNPFPVAERSAFIQAQRLGGIRIARLDAWAYQMPEAWADLIESCTASSASERPTMARVVALLEVIDDSLAAEPAVESTQAFDARALEHLRRHAARVDDDPSAAATARLGLNEVVRLRHGDAATGEDATTKVRRRAELDAIGDWTRLAHGGSSAASAAALAHAPSAELERPSAPPIVALAPAFEPEPEPALAVAPARRSRARVAALVVIMFALGLGSFGLWRSSSGPESPTSSANPAAFEPTPASDPAPLEHALLEHAAPLEPEGSARDQAIEPEPNRLVSSQPESKRPHELEAPPALAGTNAAPELVRDPCRGLEAAGRAALRKLDWPGVLAATSKKKCWTSADERARLRVEALLQTRRWAECVAAAEGFSDPKITRWSQFCAKHL